MKDDINPNNTFDYNEAIKFSVASEAYNTQLLSHLRNNPIKQDLNYYKDKKDNFFKLHHLLKGSTTLIASKKEDNDIIACVSFMMFEGNLGNEIIKYQYITDLIKDRSKNQDPIIMKALLNFGLRDYFTTDLIFGLINEKNKTARLFSISKQLIYKSKILASMNYLELIPLRKFNMSDKYYIRTADTEALQLQAIQHINEHYKDFLLFKPLSTSNLEQMYQQLPNFHSTNIVMLYANKILSGVMIYYNPEKIITLTLAKMPWKTKIATNITRTINKITGFLFNPPKENEPIKTLNVRYLSGSSNTRTALLKHANNLARQNHCHTVSLLLDENDQLQIPNKFSYRFKSYIYSAFKPGISDKIILFENRPVFFDISYS